MKTSRCRRNVGSEGPPKPVVTIAGYREDRLFPRIERAVAAILESGKVVAPVDVLVEMDLLAPEHLDDWRRGKVPYLERVDPLQFYEAVETPAHPPVSCARSQARPVDDGLHAVGQRSKASASIHEDGRSQARGGLCASLRVAGQVALPVPRQSRL